MANTAKEMIVAVGQTVSVRIEGLLVWCRVLDVKNSWGVNRLRITPLSGTGVQWVSIERVTCVHQPEPAYEPLLLEELSGGA